MTETIYIWSGEAELYADVRPAPPSIRISVHNRYIRHILPWLWILEVGLGSSTVFSGLKRAQQVIGIEPNADMRLQAMQRAATFPHTEHAAIPRWTFHADWIAI